MPRSLTRLAKGDLDDPEAMGSDKAENADIIKEMRRIVADSSIQMLPAPSLLSILRPSPLNLHRENLGLKLLPKRLRKALFIAPCDSEGEISPGRLLSTSGQMTSEGTV